MKFSLVILYLIIILFIINVNKLIDSTINYKEKRKSKKYLIYKEDNKTDRLVNIFVITFAIIITYLFMDIGRGTFNILMLAISIYAIRLDERIRIIPNELVLFLSLVGLISQYINSGIKGVMLSILSLIFTAALFFMTAFVTKKLSGNIGVGAGDIKLAMALSIILGINNLLDFWLGIVACLVAYIGIGLYTKNIRVGSYFPMCFQIMGGFMLVLYKPIYPYIIGMLG